MPQPVPTATPRRASHRIPQPIFDAILVLEGKARLAATLDGHGRPEEFVRATIDVGVQRDQLAALILEVSR